MVCLHPSSLVKQELFISKLFFSGSFLFFSLLGNILKAIGKSSKFIATFRYNWQSHVKIEQILSFLPTLNHFYSYQKPHLEISRTGDNHWWTDKPSRRAHFRSNAKNSNHTESVEIDLWTSISCCLSGTMNNKNKTNQDGQVIIIKHSKIGCIWQLVFSGQFWSVFLLYRNKIKIFAFRTV